MNMQIGTIAKWTDNKGFGFIKPKSGGKDIFIHITDYSKVHKKPCEGLRVKYFLSTDPKGRKCAVDVRPVNGHKNNGREVRQKWFSLILSAALATTLYFFYSLQLITLPLVVLYPLLSFITFGMYAKDKSAAQSGAWRTPESTLHFLALLGGWAGAAIAQSFLRHKSKKFSFRIVYWLTIIINCAGLYWLITPQGQMWVNQLLRNLNIG